MSFKPVTKVALEWIIGILSSKNIPFHVSGGFSAKLYGSPRDLNDIDIDIPEEAFEKILPDVKEYLIYGPDRYQDGKWDLLLMTLNYKGQEIDISGAYTGKVSNKDRNEWIVINSDFSRSISFVVEGIPVRAIHPEDLIGYKQHLDGDHQLVDIEAAKEYIKAVLE